MRKKVFLTGATGTMGGGVLKELLKRSEKFDTVVLARPSKKNRKWAEKYSKHDNLSIVWGDLNDYESILKGVEGADYVLHLGGMVTPDSDLYPLRTMQVNVGGAKNVVNAVLAQPNRDEIGVIYVGSVAQLGNHLPPYHWGRSGDPVCTSVFDFYSVSKNLAELAFCESGLKKWASIRQSGMLYPGLLKKANNPITFHVPLKGVLEWTTIEDSANVLANACEDWVPEEFWRGFYNLSSGPSFRLTNYEFENKILKSLSCPPVEKIFNTNWFATRNFHGEWYLDSDRLEELLHFREGISCDDYFARLKKQVPWYFSLAPVVPAVFIKMFMKHVAENKPLGTLYWLKHNDREKIDANFGSLEEWKKIPSWKEYDTSRPGDEAIILDHGYDESKPVSELDIADMKKAAEFRGGKCLSDNMTKGDLFTKLEWECQFGHRFEMTPNSVLKGGHWCPECLPEYIEGVNTWNYEEIIKKNKFLASQFGFG